MSKKNEVKKVTMFKDAYDSSHPHYVDITTVFDRIKTGKSSKEIVEKIRATTDKDEQTKLKKKLPFICFSGIFTNRTNAGITEHSGYICLDFDGINERMETVRAKMVSDKYTMACFVSPKNNGLKVVVKIPAEINNHESYFEGLRLHFKESTIDDDCEVARGCFESWDPNIYVNLNSTEFNIMVVPKVEVAIDNSTRKNRIKDLAVVYDRIKKWVDKHFTYEDGNKHRFLVAISSACNRFGLPQEVTEENLIRDYQGKASFVAEADFRDIVNRIYITYNNQFDISWLTDSGEMNDFNPTGPARDVIYLNDIRKEMIKSFKEGDSEGETTYYKTIDEHWRWKKGELTLMGGIPNHGKTTMMLQLCLIKSLKEGAKWGIFSPEQNPPIDFYKDLIHTYIGKSTERYHSNQMTDAEYDKGMDFINEHFYFVYPKDESPTPDYINERFGELIVKHKIVGCITDPYNQLDNDYGKNGRDDIYISSYLSKEKRFALVNNIYKIIIAHPKSNLTVNKSGNYECPTEYNLAGGAMWANKCDNLLATYRPFYTQEKSNPTVEFRSQKIKKQKYVGIPGTTQLHFDIFTNRYIEYAQEGTVEMNGKIINKWIGINPFEDDYLENYESKLLETQAVELGAGLQNVGMKGLGAVNSITNQIKSRREIKIDEPPDIEDPLFND